MVTIHLTNGKRFEANHGESLVDAAARSDIALPYSCKTGRCSTCKAKVVDGVTEPIHGEFGLTAQEHEQGWILGCVRSAKSDVTLDIEDLGSVVIPKRKTVPTRIHSLQALSSDVLKVVLRLPPTSNFNFLPGQYIDVIGHDAIRRSYSIANGNKAGGMLELHIRKVEQGRMSSYWFGQAKENDLLRLDGPSGTFFLRNVTGRDLVFLATGTGIAPVKAMLEGLAQILEQPRSVTVYWGGRTSDDLYMNFSAIPVVHRYVPVLSRPDTNWTGARGYVQNVYLSEAGNMDEALVYACGSEAMIQSARKILTINGLPERQFLSDAFVCSAIE
jgi:CDP-4-dehydro-6-deoxyglucose reductase